MLRVSLIYSRVLTMKYFSFVLCVLLVYIWTVKCLADTCSSTSVSWPLIMVKYSINECQLECTSRKSCRLIKFCRHLNWCEVHTEEASDCVHAGKCVIVRKDAMGNTNDNCKNCNENQGCDRITGVCSIQECKPLYISDGKIKGNNRLVGAAIVIECNPGFQEIKGVQRIECKSSGEWDHEPSCQRACEPMEISNGKVLGSNRLVGSTLDIACNAGFREINGFLQVTCTNSGTWDKSPSCKRVFPDESQQLVATWSAKLFFSSQAVSKDLANSTCQNLGPTSSLVKLDEISKFDYIVYLLEICSGSYWVDGVADNDKWKFSDGRLMPMDTSMWYNKDPSEKCIRMDNNRGFRLNNINCNGLQMYNYICETPIS